MLTAAHSHPHLCHQHVLPLRPARRIDVSQALSAQLDQQITRLHSSRRGLHLHSRGQLGA